MRSLFLTVGGGLRSIKMFAICAPANKVSLNTAAIQHPIDHAGAKRLAVSAWSWRLMRPTPDRRSAGGWEVLLTETQNIGWDA